MEESSMTSMVAAGPLVLGFVLWSQIPDQSLAQRPRSKKSLGRNRFKIGIRPFSRSTFKFFFEGFPPK